MKNMEHWTDDEFDQWIIDRSEKEFEEFVEKDWSALQAKLPQGKRRVLWPYISAVAVCISLLYFGYLNKDFFAPKPKLETNHTETHIEPKNTDLLEKKSLLSNHEVIILGENKKNEEKIKPTTYFLRQYRNVKAEKNKILSDKEALNVVNDNKTDNPRGEFNKETSSEQHSNISTTEVFVVNTSSIDSNKDAEIRKLETGVSALQTSMPQEIPVYVKAFAILASLVDVGQYQPTDYFENGFQMGIGFSPDISTVANNAIDRVGTANALFGSYRFNKRTTVEAGLIRTKKYYDAYPEQYTWIWKMPNTPLLEVTATCRMIDIPVGVRYDFVSKPKTSLFGSLGSTTYYMLKETYNYNYENNADPTIRWKKWEGSTGFYWLGTINLTGGIEQKIGPGLSVQIEPFAKIPTQELGFGQVKLKSFGTFFTLKKKFF